MPLRFIEEALAEEDGETLAIVDEDVVIGCEEPFEDVHGPCSDLGIGELRLRNM